MNQIIEQFIEPLMGPTNALDRIRGVGETFSTSKGDSSTVWWVLIIGSVVIAAMVTAFAWAYKREQMNELWQKFWKHAARAGLGNEERSLLRNIAIGAGLKNPDLIFNSPDDFYYGIAQLEEDNGKKSLFGSATMSVCGSCRFYQSLQNKLGFPSSASASESVKPEAINLGPIHPGTMLSVIRQRPPQDFEVILTAADEDNGEMTVETHLTPNINIGESWMLRYPEGGILWEFDARVIRLDNENIYLRPSGEVRYIDRRRFVRIPVDKPAQIASFPFEKDKDAAWLPISAPQFTPAKLVQLAGPGVLLESEMQADVDDRVLVVLELENRCIEGIGVVRRGNNGDDSGIAVELLGLDTAQVADLTRETNAMAGQAHDAKQLQSVGPVEEDS